MRSESQIRRPPDRIAELPVGARRVHARVEVVRPVEVVLGLRRVAHLAANARHAEDAHVVALVRVADQVELPAAVEQGYGSTLRFSWASRPIV